MDKKVIDIMNEQINYEMHSGYIYLQASLVMEKENYKGYSQWLFAHYKEEFEHAEDFMSYLQKRDVTPTLMPIQNEDVKVTTPLEVAQLILDHERKVTKRIYEIHDVAKNANDYATEIFMHKYINEQIEEEDVAKDIVDSFTLAGDNISARLTIDRSLNSK